MADSQNKVYNIIMLGQGVVKNGEDSKTTSKGRLPLEAIAVDVLKSKKRNSAKLATRYQSF